MIGYVVVGIISTVYLIVSAVILYHWYKERKEIHKMLLKQHKENLERLRQLMKLRGTTERDIDKWEKHHLTHR